MASAKAVSFLAKKSWHTATMRHMEKVWKAEERAKLENKKMAELKQEKAEEREMEDLRRMHEQTTGLKKRERVDFLYSEPLLSGPSADDYLLGVKYKDNGEDNAAKNVQSKLGSLWLDQPALGSDSIQDKRTKVREDPLFAIKKEEQNQKAILKNNPIMMEKLKQQLAQRKLLEQLKKEKKEKKEKKRKRKEEKAAEEKIKRVKLEEGIERDASLLAATAAAAAAATTMQQGGSDCGGSVKEDRETKSETYEKPTHKYDRETRSEKYDRSTDLYDQSESISSRRSERYSDKSDSRYERSTDRYEKSEGRYERSTDRYEKSESRYESSTDRYEKSDSRYERSTDRYENSDSRYERSTDRYEKSDSRYERSTDRYGKSNRRSADRYERSDRHERPDRSSSYDRIDKYEKSTEKGDDGETIRCGRYESAKVNNRAVKADPYYYSSSFNEASSSTTKQKLGEEERKKKLEQMQNDAKMLEEKRLKAVTKYIEEETAEQLSVLSKDVKKEGGPAFLSTMSKAVYSGGSTASVADRIKRNAYYIQKTNLDERGIFT